MKNKAIVTLSIGMKYKAISDLTHPTMKEYAKKIDADFIVIDKQEISKTNPQWEKFRIFNLLNRYQRILYLDSDLIVRNDCPDIFKEVPEDELGLFNEAPFTDRRGLIKSMSEAFGRNVEDDGKYYNTGVMVISRKHKFLFEKPDNEINNFFEQTYLNMIFAEEKPKMNSLNYRFNRMSCLDSWLGISRLDSYIVHYAGCPGLDKMKDLILNDLEAWREASPKSSPSYKYKQRVVISVSGGLGDQINAQPAVRFMREKVLPNAEIVVMTHYPRIFRDIEGIEVYEQGDFTPEPDTAYRIIDSFPPPSSVTYSVVGNILCHTVDYCSIALLKRTIPFLDKSIKLHVTLKEIQKAIDLVGIRDLRDLVLIHPGKHWESKTMPFKWWEEIIDGLLEKKIPVCIIGKTGDPGVWDFKDKKGIVNLVDLTDLETLIALISQAKILLSSDSSPVHIAGAFDNEIALIPTVKHPDHVLPFRNGSVFYKTSSLYKKLVLDDYSTAPTEINEKAVSSLLKTWSYYLLDSFEIINKIERIYSGT